RTGLESRVTILGHVQRGGTPSPADRLLATRLGVACVDFIAEGRVGVMVAVRGESVEAVDLKEVAGKRRMVPLDHPMIHSARRLGIALGACSGLSGRPWDPDSAILTPMSVPRSILSRELLPASIAIYTTVAIVAFEGLAITAALPDLAAELGSVTLLPWVITSFLLASAGPTAITVTLSDALATSAEFRRAAIAVAASALSAELAPALADLLVALVAQGASGGAVSAVGIAAVALVSPHHLAGRVLAAKPTVW